MGGDEVQRFRTCKCRLAGLLATKIEAAQGLLDDGAEALAGGRQVDSRGAVEQRRADPRFQRANAAAERRLRDILAFGRAGKVPGLRPAR